MSIVRDRSPIARNIEHLDPTMSINYTELNIAKETILQYEGGSKNLSYFIQQCEKLLTNYRNNSVGQENCTHNKLLYEICCSKLIGAARDPIVVANCSR